MGNTKGTQCCWNDWGFHMTSYDFDILCIIMLRYLWDDGMDFFVESTSNRSSRQSCLSLKSQFLKLSRITSHFFHRTLVIKYYRWNIGITSVGDEIGDVHLMFKRQMLHGLPNISTHNDPNFRVNTEGTGVSCWEVSYDLTSGGSYWKYYNMGK